MASTTETGHVTIPDTSDPPFRELSDPGIPEMV